eukprot:593420-Prymnesium_polylepis.1
MRRPATATSARAVPSSAQHTGPWRSRGGSGASAQEWGAAARTQPPKCRTPPAPAAWRLGAAHAPPHSALLLELLGVALDARVEEIDRVVHRSPVDG